MQAALHSAVRYKWQFTASTPLARCPAPRRPASLRRQVRLQVVMVEGHQCHRVGAAHRRLLLGKAFAASSPNGRFADGAAAISGKVLRDIQVHGKNLFYFFSGRDADGGSGSTAGGDRAPLSLAPEDVDPLAEPEDADTEFGGNGGTAASPQAAARRQASGSPLSAPGTPGQGLLGSLGAAASAAAAAAEDAVVVHIHFGMSGAFRTALLPGPEATPTTRLRLEHSGSGLVAHLSAMTVAHGSMDLYRDRLSKLGPDPLRPGDDPERFWARVQDSKKPIGLLLMDQSAIAGVGNIYRAEILYKSRVHPEQPGHTVDRATFDTIWHHCVDLLGRGFRSGSILTVDPEDAIALGKPWTRRYIYNQRKCGRCHGAIRSWDMAGRTVYCCDTCQPLQRVASPAAHHADSACATPVGKKKGRGVRSPAATAAAEVADAAADAVAATLLTPARLKSMAAARVAKEFVSHCAPDEPEDAPPTKLTCPQLRAALRELNLDTRGTKPVLVARLEAARRWEGDNPAAQGSAAVPLVSEAAPVKSEPFETPSRGNKRRTQRADSNSSSADELDTAEERLAAALSVPTAKRARRRSRVLAPEEAADEDEIVPATPMPAPAKRVARRGLGAPSEGRFASASAAAEEKAAAGESRAVEHVALHADAATEAMMFPERQLKQQRG